MDIAPFYELRSRLYFAAAAGCSSIGEDFRYKRAVEGFVTLSKANKAFGKLYDMCASLIESDSPASEITDCIALAEALAVTQGVYSDNEETKPVKENMCKPRDIPASKIEEISVIINRANDSLDNFTKSYAEYLRDPRIMGKFLDFMENGRETREFRLFSEIVCTKIFGKEIVPLLKATVNKSGKQIKYVGEICGEEENDWYVSLAENRDNPEGVRKEAIAALSCGLSNTEKLIELYKTEKGKVKKEALMSLAKLSPHEAEPIFKKLCDKYKDGNLDYISESHGKVCEEFAVKILTELLEALRTYKDNPKVLKERVKEITGTDYAYAETLIEGRYYKLLKNKTGESADDVFIALSESFDSDGFKFSLNVMLEEGLSGKLANETAAQIERLYVKKPEYFQEAETFLNLLKNPEEKISVSSDRFSIVRLLTHIDYMPLIGKYNIGYEKIPLVIIGERLPQSVIDFLCDTVMEFLIELEKLENGLENNFEKLAQREGDNFNVYKAVTFVRVMVLNHVFNMFTMINTGKCAETDYERIKSAVMPAVLKAAVVCPEYLGRSFIKKYFKGTDEELIKLNTKNVINSFKYANWAVAATVLVEDKPKEIVKAAIDDLEKEIAEEDFKLLSMLQKEIDNAKIKIKE